MGVHVALVHHTAADVLTAAELAELQLLGSEPIYVAALPSDDDAPLPDLSAYPLDPAAVEKVKALLARTPR